MTTHHELNLFADDLDELLDNLGYNVRANVDADNRIIRYDNGGYRVTISVESLRSQPTTGSLHSLIANVYLHEPQHAPRYADTDLRLNWTNEIVLAHAVAGLLNTADMLAGMRADA